MDFHARSVASAAYGVDDTGAMREDLISMPRLPYIVRHVERSREYSRSVT